MLDEALLQVLAAIGMGRQVSFAPDGQPPLEPVDIGLGPYFFHLLYCILGHEIKDVHEPASVHRQGVQVRRPRRRILLTGPQAFLRWEKGCSIISSPFMPVF